MPWRDSDMDDYDAFQPCFFESEVEEDFYDAPAPGPSMDIWKKFELLPTPPRSPKHEPAALGGYSTEDKLEMVSDLLGDCLDMDPPRGGSTTASSEDSDCVGCFGGCSRTCSVKLLKANLIQDCMWSGLSLPQQLAQLEKPCTTASITVGDVTSSIPSLETGTVETDCVDPTAVFPFPISRENSLGTDTPSDSEEEEIDVVTVVGEKIQTPSVSQTKQQFQLQEERRQSVRVLEQPQSARAASAHVAAMHNYSSQPQPTALASMLTSSTHSYKRSRQSSHSPQRAIKKFRISLPQNTLHSVVQKLKITGHHHYSKSRPSSSHNSSRSCSDSEDSEGKRAQHNVLERKRRNDLKSSFFRLRDHIPDLCTQEKAAKVVILRKATDYITGLRRKEKHLVAEFEQLKRTNERLRRRLEALQ